MNETIYYECNEENYKFILNELHNKDKEIERLNNELELQNIEMGSEIERLKGEKESLNSLVNSCQREIRRLNNIINELEKELKKDYDNYVSKNRLYGTTYKAGANTYREHILYKINELKENTNGNTNDNGNTNNNWNTIADNDRQ